jgi:hypothetical protein
MATTIMENQQPPQPPIDKNKAFSVAEQFKMYLELVGLDQRTMPTYQLRETRRAFYGGFGIMLVGVMNEVGKLGSEEEAKAMVDKMIDEVADFYKEEIPAFIEKPKSKIITLGGDK